MTLSEWDITCSSCTHFIRFTNQEIEGLRPELRKYMPDGQTIGACSAKRHSDPPIVLRYLNREIENCIFYKKGSFREGIGVKCHHCRTGTLQIVRPVAIVPYHPFIGCTNYPNCHLTHTYIPLTTFCETCKSPLMLSCKETLACYCPKCKRRADNLILLHAWPTLFSQSSDCIHGIPFSDCARCKQAVREKTSLIQLEMSESMGLIQRVELEDSELAHNGKNKIGENQNNYWNEESYEDSDEDYYEDYGVQDEINEIYDELGDYMENWHKSNEDGWFYPD